MQIYAGIPPLFPDKEAYNDILSAKTAKRGPGRLDLYCDMPSHLAEVPKFLEVYPVIRSENYFQEPRLGDC
jgi:hypothetical protein